MAKSRRYWLAMCFVLGAVCAAVAGHYLMLSLSRQPNPGMGSDTQAERTMSASRHTDYPEWANVSPFQLRAASRTGVKLALKVEVGQGQNIKCVYIPSSSFLMGTDPGMGGAAAEQPEHPVELTRGFYLSVTEVTQGQWMAVMDSAPWAGKDFVRDAPDSAATYISWGDAMSFCRTLSKATGRSFRLPTEAEWEYACRAGSSTVYSYGDNTGDLALYAWYDANACDVGELYAHAVGRKKANAWGLYDVHGNVWEWCLDQFGPYPCRRTQDPTGASTGGDRVARGGCWYISDAWWCRSAFRNAFPPNVKRCNIGFRVVLESPPHSQP